MEIFKLFGSIGIKNQDANRAIDETTGKAESASGRIGETFKKMAGFLGTLFAGKAIFDFGKSVVEAAATAKAINSQFDQVFDGITDLANDSLKGVAKEVGALPNRIKPAFNQIASFAKVAGMDAKESLDFTSRATKAAADSAAFYDKSLEETTETLKSYLKGNFSVADNLGILSTETTRNAKATELFGQKYKDLSGIQQQQVLMQMFEDANKVSGAMGQAARESDGFENVMGNLKQAWQDFKVIIGGPLLAPVVTGVQLATDWIGRLQAKFQEFEPRITLFKELVTSVYDVIFGSLSVKDNVDLLVKLGMDEATATTIMDTASKIGAAMTSLYDMVFGSQSKKDNIDFMTSLGIDEATATSIAEIGESIRNAFDNVGQTIDLVIGMVGDLVGEFVGFSTSEDTVRSISEALEEVAQFIEDATGKVKDFVTWFEQGGTAVDVLKSAIVGVTAAWTGYQVVTGIIQGIETVRNGLLALGNGLMLARFVQTGALTAAEGAQAAATMGATGAFQLFNMVLMANPIVIIIGLIAALVAGLIWFFTQTETGRQMWSDFMTFLSQTWENIVATATEKWSSFSAWISGLWSSVTTAGQDIWSSFVTTITNFFANLIAGAQEKWQSFSSRLSNLWTNLVSTGSNLFTDLKNKVSSIFEGIRSKASEIWDGIKSKISGAINGAKDAVDRAISTIKSIMNFSWKLPHLKLPRISVSGDFSLKPLRVPSFGIEWFAKGGIMNQPTLFGMNGNNLMAGGEAGPEAILPLNNQTLKPIGQAVAEAWGVGQSDNAGLLLEIIELLKALLLKEGDVYLDLEKVGRLTYEEHGRLMERGI